MKKSSVFYTTLSLGGPTVVRKGYLLKSPPYNLLMREKSWRRRFFVLSKSNEQDYQLKYFVSEEEEKKTPLGQIDLKQLTVMYTDPHNHPKWKWVHKNTKRSPSCVLYLKSSGREYFLVGNNSSDVNDWFIALRNPQLAGSEEHPYEVVDCNKEIGSYERRKSEPTSPIYNYPSAFLFDEHKDDGYIDMGKEGSDAELQTDNRLTRSVPCVFIAPVTRPYALSLPAKMDASRNRKNSTGGEESDKDTAGEEESDKVTTGGEESDISPTDGSDCSNEKKMVLKIPDRFERPNSMDIISGHKEQDVEVQQADLKKHLTLSEVDGRLSVSAWTGQPLGLFQEGDRVLGLNDLLTCSMAEFNALLSKTFKNQVKLTVLREQNSTNLRRYSL